MFLTTFPRFVYIEYSGPRNPVSSSHNPLDETAAPLGTPSPEAGAVSVPAAPPGDLSLSAAASASPVSVRQAKPIENPPWTILEVVALALATLVVVSASLVLVALAAHRWIAPREPWLELAKQPEVVVLAQVLAYCLVFVLMYWLAGARGGRPRDTLHWNWPQHWAIFLWYGIALSIGLQLFAHLMHMPKTLPIDQFFETPREAWLLSIFGITLAPLMEELFFRGFLYPVLVRRMNILTAILLTGIAFGAIHGAQLMYSWGPVLVIVLVGIALTAVRAYTNSVGSTVLMHIGYNLTITVAMYYGTDGFRHLDKLKQ